VAGPLSLIAPHHLEAMIAKAKATPAGCFLEVGVYQGGSAVLLTQAGLAQLRPVYLYDTFQGIPYRGKLDSHQVGDFADTSLERVRSLCPGARVIPGIFPQSAIPMEPIAFAHLDCDQYQSYRESLAYLAPRMVPGGIIWCDDADCLPGAAEAVREFLTASDRAYAFHAEKTYLRF